MALVRAHQIAAQLTSWVRLLIFATLVVACGGDGGPPAISVTAVTVTGMPAATLAPRQTAQLGAQATLSDGSMQDVTATATWSTSDVNVLTVSATGLMTATGLGQAEVIAAFSGRSGRAAQVVVPPAAYFLNEVEYAFDYQLDAQGRVDNYRISKREGLSYPSPASEELKLECVGSFHGEFKCERWSVDPYSYSPATMVGSPNGFEVSWYDMSSVTWATETYRFDEHGLVEVKHSGYHGMGHPNFSETSSLKYSESGRLSAVTTGYSVSVGSSQRTEAQLTVDSQGRLQRAEGTIEVSPIPTVSYYGRAVSVGRGGASGEDYDALHVRQSRLAGEPPSGRRIWSVAPRSLLDHLARQSRRRRAVHRSRTHGVLRRRGRSSERSLPVGPVADRAAICAPCAYGIERIGLLRGHQQPPSVAVRAVPYAVGAPDTGQLSGCVVCERFERNRVIGDARVSCAYWLRAIGSDDGCVD
jgi:Bacterial Ig-like domain (group 2)